MTTRGLREPDAETAAAETTTPRRTVRYDTYLERLHADWRRANHEESRLAEELGSKNPKVIEAEERSTKALIKLLEAEATSAEGLLLKLRIAFDHEDYLVEAIDPTNRFVAPRMLVSVLKDVEAWALRDQDQQILADGGSADAGTVGAVRDGDGGAA